MLSNTAIPKYYAQFRDAVLRGHIPVCNEVAQEKEFIERWCNENSPYGVTKVIQGVKTESVPLGELKKLASERMLLFDQEIMMFTMGNCIALEDTNGNRKLYKRRREEKIDAVAAMMDAYIAYKINVEAFE